MAISLLSLMNNAFLCTLTFERFLFEMLLTECNITAEVSFIKLMIPPDGTLVSVKPVCLFSPLLFTITVHNAWWAHFPRTSGLLCGGSGSLSCKSNPRALKLVQQVPQLKYTCKCHISLVCGGLFLYKQENTAVSVV